MALGSVVNDDELDTARKSLKLLNVIKTFQNHHMEIEKVEFTQKVLMKTEKWYFMSATYLETLFSSYKF